MEKRPTPYLAEVLEMWQKHPKKTKTETAHHTSHRKSVAEGSVRGSYSEAEWEKLSDWKEKDDNEENGAQREENDGGYRSSW